MDKERWVVNSLCVKICRHKVSDLYHDESASNRQLNIQLFYCAGLKMCTVYTVVLPFRVPVVNVTAKHCAAIGYSLLSQRSQTGLTTDTSPT